MVLGGGIECDRIVLSVVQTLVSRILGMFKRRRVLNFNK